MSKAILGRAVHLQLNYQEGKFIHGKKNKNIIG